MTVWAIIKTQQEGFHFWKDAPESVSFLRNKHRHIFFFKVWVSQNHNERDLEYFILKSKVESLIPTINGPQSCETIASNLQLSLVNLFSHERQVKVEVTEDNENGALIE
jgi:hypothetical protein